MQIIKINNVLCCDHCVYIYSFSLSLIQFAFGKYVNYSRNEGLRIISASMQAKSAKVAQFKR